MDAELMALSSTAATTVVGLLATDAWEQARHAMGSLWRRVHPQRAETVEAELTEARTEVLAARASGDEQAEQALVEEWQSRLRRLLAADPQLADEMRRIVAEFAAEPPSGDGTPGTVRQDAKASHGSRVYQAGRDLHVTGQ
ncbi:hypothetical protein [Peterkaempfera bronchialis]|uniref:hypothetical protein n=1 Tax=Peterkaempfera bronchialis TaxID=2126346 RepID=UPI003C2D1342